MEGHRNQKGRIQAQDLSTRDWSQIVRSRSIDRGPAVLVAFCATVVHGMIAGVLTSGSIFYPSLIEATGYPISVISWTVSIQCAVAFCLAPVYNLLFDIISPRLTTCLGTILTSASFVTAAFITNYFVFLGCYSLLGGIGIGITFVRVFGTLAEYFSRYRILAVAVCSSGAGLGTIAYSKIIDYMIETFTWRVALIGLGLIHLHLLVLNLIIRPLPPDVRHETDVLIPDQPDLTEANLSPNVKVDPYNLFASAYSLRSLRDNTFTSCVACNIGGTGLKSETTEFGDREIPQEQIRAVVEFVRMDYNPTLPEKICMHEPTFLPDIGANLQKQLEETAKKCLLDVDFAFHTIYIPIIFLLGEMLVVRPLVYSQVMDVEGSSTLNHFLDSQMDIGGPAVTGHVVPKQHSKPLTDSFASSMVAIHDRRLLKQTVRAVLNEARVRVQQATKRLNQRGLLVCPTPIITLIDQTNYTAQTNFGSRMSSDYVCVLAYPEKEEQIMLEGPIVKKSTPLTSGFTDLGSEEVLPSKLTKQFVEDPAKSTAEHSDAPPMIASNTMRFHSETDTTRRCSQEFYISLISIDRPAQAADLLASKLNYEQKLGADEKHMEDSSFLANCPIAKPCFFAFLASRVFTCITDVIMYAHLSNFGIWLGFDSTSAAGLLSFIGMASMIGRLGIGLLGQFANKVEARLTVGVTLLFGAVAAGFLPFFTNYITMAVLAFIYGLCISPSFAFSTLITIELLGPAQYARGMPFLFQFESAGVLIGGPLGGFIKEVANDYTPCFVFAGISVLTAGLIIIWLGLLDNPFIQRCLVRLKGRDPRSPTID
ncbi:hypothetical protein PHET_01865 [Paragonimus heterotremus]|uniref:Major facilitator superfamily (MFS) profile domain-containing protein n=1 Tax=Paragonimus heterotremus TaxID=100268 RepID=A0A8J4TLI4_9TREM|nr:hypothetical protein PHET_01865 [Paragonimus heterotremus]